jgi:pentapeptide MXKDX repeat protein
MSLEKNENLVEKALLQMKTIEEAISENAKGILASTMKEEISELVKESLFGSKSKSSLHEQEEEGDEEEVSADDEINVDDVNVSDDGVEMGDVEAQVGPEGGELDITMMGAGAETDNEDELPPLDMTGAKPGEVLKVFKAMGDEDGIIVVKDDNKIHLTDNNTDTEYFIDLGDDSEMSMEEPMENMNESVIYELVFEEDEKMGKHEMEEEDYNLEEELDEELDETIYELEVSESMKPVGIGFGKMKNGLSKSSVNNKGFDEDMENGLKSEKKGKGPKFNYGKIKHGVTENYMEEDYMEEGWMDEEMIDDMKTESDYMEGDYMEGNYMEGDYMEGNYMEGDYMEGNYMEGDYMEGDYMEGDCMEGDCMEGDELPGETTEASRTMTYMRRAQRDRVAAPSQLRKESVVKELDLLKEKNEEYKKALDFFRNKLYEVAVFNSNLAYSTRLFTEHSTTKQEKINILRRFDNVETIKESKSLYKAIKSELEGSNNSDVVTESIQRQVVKTPSNGSASNLIESKTYENPQFMRMRDLMAKIK